MSKNITSRIIKRIALSASELCGEINYKELRASQKKRLKRMKKQKDITTCKILGQKYQYSPELSYKKQIGYIKMDNGKYLRIVKPKKNIMPASILMFMLHFLPIITTISVTAGGVAATVGTIILVQKAIPQNDSSNTSQPTINIVTTEPSSDNTNQQNDDFISRVTIGSYTGDELEGLEQTPSDSAEEAYTIIDGIIYQGEYLAISKGTAIPLGNNPENTKTGVSLEFIIKEGDELIFKSPKLLPGTGVDFIPGLYLNNDLHKLHLIVNVYHKDGTQDVGYDQYLSIKIIQ